jgi:MFS transporter, DHA1 family, staphyloferrin A biosynthesis exporter
LHPSQPRNKIAAFGLRTLSSLRIPAYRIYFLAVLGQFASLSMSTATSPLLVYRLTGSSALLGTTSLAYAVPMIIMSLLGGAIADRFQKKNIIMFGLIALALVPLAVGLCIVTGLLSKEREGSWLILAGSSFFTGIISGAMLPARQAIIPELVKREQTMNAVALNMIGMNVLSLIGPAAAGFLIDGVGFAFVYFSMAALNIYGAIMIIFIPHTSPLGNRSESIVYQIKTGFKYILKDRIILLILLFTTLAVIMVMPYQQLLPIYVDDILKVGAKGMGILLSVSGIGALVGSITLASLPNKNRGILLLSSGLVSSAALLIFAFSHSWVLSLGCMAFLGIGQTLRGTVGGALAQSYTEPVYMGRVMSIMMMQWGLMSLCTFFAGMLAEVLPVQVVIGGLAGILCLVTLYLMLAAPKIRKLD